MASESSARLHIITGPPKSGRTTAARARQVAEPQHDWLICDASDSGTVDSYLASGRNVIWVPRRVTGELVVTMQQIVKLPTTFGSSVLAALAPDGPRIRFTLTWNSSNQLAWLSKGGHWYAPSALVDPVVSFVAEEV